MTALLHHYYPGGSEWKNVHSRIQGIGTPPSQLQGDTWGMLMSDITKGYSPTHVFTNGGANDIDCANDLFHYLSFSSQYAPIKVKAGIRPSSRYHQKYGKLAPQFSIFDVNAYLDITFEEITKHMDEVLNILYDTF